MKKCGLFFLLISAGSLYAFNGKSIFFSTRPQSVNAVRELVGWQKYINMPATDAFYGAFSATPEYARSFRPGDIATSLFGSCQIGVSGSGSDNRGEKDILADYFGLPRDFKSVVSFEPHISHFLVDFNFYFGLDNVARGLFFRMHAPVVSSKWDLNMCEHVLEPGSEFYPAGYMSGYRIERSELAKNLTNVMCGRTTFGDMRDPLAYGKICGSRRRTTMSDLQAALGWNHAKDTHHIGSSLRVSAPLGRRPNAEYLFEPIIGNGKHWELGIGFTWHCQLWQAEDLSRDLNLYLDANITHLFAAKQKRSFDLKNNGAGSRYMLLEDMIDPSIDLFFDANASQPAPNQYARRLIPAINVTTLDVQVYNSVQADIVSKIAYYHHNWSFDLGYNFWVRTEDKLKSCPRFEGNRYAMKGDMQLYGFLIDNPFALNATQSNATLHGGQGPGNINFTNQNIDARVLAYNREDVLSNLNTGAIQIENIYTSNSPVLLQEDALDTASGLSKSSYTHKLFAHANYVWQHHEKRIPFFGIGVSSEWASSYYKNQKRCMQSSCKKECGKGSAIHSQWAIWLKGGVAY